MRISRLQFIWSYILGILIDKKESAYSGTLEVWLINGRKMIHSPNANYSYDTLHRVFQKAIAQTDILVNPPQKVLILGFGGGSVYTILHKELQLSCHITGVDIDPALFELAETHFDIHASPSLNLHIADAVDFIRNTSESYDWIVIDLFIDNRVPDVFSGKDFMENVIRHLHPGGTLLMNFITSDAEGTALFEKALVHFPPEKTTVLKPLKHNRVIYYKK
ncbi:MAG: fused MFS/spermidine synthase [Flavobacteriales bacterium]|nr:fused MFS/spermidine synthase [Flavobacteriales bacterium]